MHFKPFLFIYTSLITLNCFFVFFNWAACGIYVWNQHSRCVGGRGSRTQTQPQGTNNENKSNKQTMKASPVNKVSELFFIHLLIFPFSFHFRRRELEIETSGKWQKNVDKHAK